MVTYPINDDLDYNELCDHIEMDKPQIVDINYEELFFTTTQDKFILSKRYSFVLDDIVTYVQSDGESEVKEVPIIKQVKEEDKITNTIDLELFTTYILDKSNQDKILFIDKDNLLFETEKYIISTTKKFSKELFDRIQLIVENKFEQILFDNINSPSKVISVSGFNFNLY